MKKGTIVILIIVVLSILAAIVSIMHFIEYISFPKDKIGMLMDSVTYKYKCDSTDGTFVAIE